MDLVKELLFQSVQIYSIPGQLLLSLKAATQIAEAKGWAFHHVHGTESKEIAQARDWMQPTTVYNIILQVIIIHKTELYLLSWSTAIPYLCLRQHKI